MTERRWLTPFLVSITTELRCWSRERVAVASALLLPVALAVLTSLALGRVDETFSATFAVADLDEGPAAAGFLDRTLGSPSLEGVVSIEEVTTRSEAAGLVDAGEVDAAIVLPDGLSAKVTAGDSSGIAVLPSAQAPAASDLAHLLVEQFEIRSRAIARVVEHTGREPSEPWPLEVAVSAPDGQELDAVRHYGPAVGLFFVLVTLGFGASRLVADRQRGIVERLDSAPLPPAAVLVGRATAGVLVGGLSLLVLAVTLQIGFGRSWGPLGPLALVLVATMVAMVGVASLIAVVARTPEQAQTLAVGAAFVFAIASGSLAPPGSTSTRSVVADLVPTTHALDAFSVLATEHAGIGAVAVSLGALLAFGGLGALTTSLLARRLTR